MHPVSPFCFCPHSPFCPPPTSPPPLLTLVFSPAVSSVPGTAAPRYSPTKTHMHFQTDEEEEEVKKRVCEPGRPPQPSWRTGPPFTAHLVHAAAAAVCLRDRFGSAFHTFPRFGVILFFDQFSSVCFLDFSLNRVLYTVLGQLQQGLPPTGRQQKTAALFPMFTLFLGILFQLKIFKFPICF